MTFAEPTVPEPFDTVQVCPDGLDCTVTAYAAPPASWVPNVNEPFALTLSMSEPLSASTTVPDSPDTVPPTEYVVPPEPDPTLPPDHAPASDEPEARIPGTPPDNVESVAVTRATPFCSSVIVLPTAVTCNCVPAGSAPELYVLPSCFQFPPLRKNSISTGLPLFQ